MRPMRQAAPFLDAAAIVLLLLGLLAWFREGAPNLQLLWGAPAVAALALYYRQRRVDRTAE
jgi:hypothetical protein